MEQLNDNATETCQNCGSTRYGAYCTTCGQARVDPRDRTIPALLQQLFGEITSLDGKFWRSVRELLFRPGGLTSAHVQGRRVSFLHPWRLFLVVNVLYFFVQPFSGFGGYNTSMDSQMTRQVYSDAIDIEGLLRSQIHANTERTLLAEGTHRDSLDQTAYSARFRTEARLYEDRYDRRSQAYATTLVLLFIPVIAALLALLYSGRREALLADHAIFATHLMAWQLLAVGCLYLPLVGLLGRLSMALAGGQAEFYALLAQYPALDWIQNFLAEQSSIILISIYVFLAVRRFYHDSRFGATVRTLVVVFAMVPILWAYRLLLFWLTYGAIAE